MFLLNIHTVDPYFAFVLFLSCAISFVRGFIREVLSLVFWIAAVWMAFTHGSELAILFTGLSKSKTIQIVLGSLSAFLATLFVGMIANYVLWLLIRKTGLSGTDRLLGLLFGMARGLLVVTVLLVLARVTPMGKEAFFADAMMSTYLQPLSDPMQIFLQKQLADFIPKLNPTADKDEKDKPLIAIPLPEKPSSNTHPDSTAPEKYNKLLPRTD